jgi:hypothetical protein
MTSFKPGCTIGKRAKEEKWPDTAKRQARVSRMLCIEKSEASCDQERMEEAGL